MVHIGRLPSNFSMSSTPCVEPSHNSPITSQLDHRYLHARSRHHRRPATLSITSSPIDHPLQLRFLRLLSRHLPIKMRVWKRGRRCWMPSHQCAVVVPRRPIRLHGQSVPRKSRRKLPGPQRVNCLKWTQKRTSDRQKSLRGRPSGRLMVVFVDIGLGWQVRRRGRCNMVHQTMLGPRDGEWMVKVARTELDRRIRPPMPPTRSGTPLKGCLALRPLRRLRPPLRWRSKQALVLVLDLHVHWVVSLAGLVHQGSPRMPSTASVPSKSSRLLRSLKLEPQGRVSTPTQAHPISMFPNLSPRVRQFLSLRDLRPRLHHNRPLTHPLLQYPHPGNRNPLFLDRVFRHPI